MHQALGQQGAECIEERKPESIFKERSVSMEVGGWSQTRVGGGDKDWHLNCHRITLTGGEGGVELTKSDWSFRKIILILPFRTQWACPSVDTIHPLGESQGREAILPVIKSLAYDICQAWSKSRLSRFQVMGHWTSLNETQLPCL